MIAFAMASVSCSDGRIDYPAFDGDRAYAYLVQQVELGPRVPGTEASSACRELLRQHFMPLGANIDSQHFSFFDPYSRTDIPLINLTAGFAGKDSAAPGILLMAHYDSRPRTDYAATPELREQPIAGANDGASGVAVLMELGTVLGRARPPVNVDLVFVDGEDWGKQGDYDYYLLGSREFARRGIRGKYQFGIVVDMVGDAEQKIYRDHYSETYCKYVNDAIWQAAAKLGIDTFQDSVRHAIIDDHHSLISSGVAAVVIIDMQYPYWHTEFDTPDKCSARSLANVGRVLAELIYDSKSWPGK
ncbi:MAG: M28 family peptidase [Candidatus Zixiibacteriota bacterium]